MELLLNVIATPAQQAFPVRIELGEEGRIFLADCSTNCTGIYVLAAPYLIMAILDLDLGFHRNRNAVSLYSGKKTGPGQWEGTLVGTSPEQDPTFLPGKWTAIRIPADE